MLALHPAILSIWLLRLASMRWVSRESLLPFFAISPAPVNCTNAIQADYKDHPLAFYPPLACAATKLERELEAQSQPRLALFYRAYRSWSPTISKRTREASSALISTLPNYASIARNTLYRLMHPRKTPTPIPGFLRHDMSVPSTLGSCGRGTILLYPPLPIRGYLRHDMSVPSTLGFCGRGTRILHTPRASRTAALRKVLGVLRTVIVCYCLTLSVLTALPNVKRSSPDAYIGSSTVYGDLPDSRSLEDTSQRTDATSRVRSHETDPPNKTPESAPAEPVEPPPTRKVGKRGGPSGPHRDRWKEPRRITTGEFGVRRVAYHPPKDNTDDATPPPLQTLHSSMCDPSWRLYAMSLVPGPPAVVGPNSGGKGDIVRSALLSESKGGGASNNPTYRRRRVKPLTSCYPSWNHPHTANSSTPSTAPNLPPNSN